MFLGVFTTKKGKKQLMKQEKEASKAGAVSNILYKRQKQDGTLLINNFKKTYNTNETHQSSREYDENGPNHPRTVQPSERGQNHELEIVDIIDDDQ